MKLKKFNLALKRIAIMGLLIVSLVISGCSSSAATVVNTGDKDDTSVVAESTSDALSEPSYAHFFTEDEVHSIDINIDKGDWEAMLADPTAEEYYEANITVDGVTLSDVAFRTKGNMTLQSVAQSDSDRYSFKINAGKYVDDQTLEGLDEFVLNNMYTDASYMREYLSYKAMAAQGMTVPLATYVKVSINDEYFGFYLMVESVDDSFLEHTFGDNDGNLYRMDEGSTLSIENGEIDMNPSQKNGDDESLEDLTKLVETLNAMPEGETGDIESVLDVESALKYIAANTVLSNYDSYQGNHNQNYYLYNDGGIFKVIPWDYNMSFGGFGSEVLTDIDIEAPVSGISSAELPLVDHLLAVEAYNEAYKSYLNDFMTYFDDFELQVSKLADLIGPYVENDPTAFTSYDDFLYQISYQENYVTTASSGRVSLDSVPSQDQTTEVDGSPQEMPPTTDANSSASEMAPRDDRGRDVNGNAKIIPPLDGQLNEAGRDKPGGMTSNVPLVNNLVDRLNAIASQLQE